MRTYSQAITMARILDWQHHQHDKDWVQIEQNKEKTMLAVLPWIPKLSRKAYDKYPLITRNILKHWDQLRRQYEEIINPDGPLMPITGNSQFLPGMITRDFLNGTESKFIRAYEVLNETGLMSKMMKMK